MHSSEGLRALATIIAAQARAGNQSVLPRCPVQAQHYSWPIYFAVEASGYTKLEYYSFVAVEGLVLNSADTPFIVPARIPMMVLRDPPGGTQVT